MMSETPDLRMQILKLLRLRSDQGDDTPPTATLEELAAGAAAAASHVEDACATLAHDGLIGVDRSAGHANNPVYHITPMGRKFLDPTEPLD
ncbi:MAG: hypothetical protein WD208_09480 [Dehalococcoidia bacterium]